MHLTMSTLTCIPSQKSHQCSTHPAEGVDGVDNSYTMASQASENVRSRPAALIALVAQDSSAAVYLFNES